MYLDALGNVTVGVGHECPTAEEANRVFGTDVSVHWAKVKSMKPAMSAAYYKYSGCPIMADDQMDEVLNDDIETAKQSAFHLFSDLDSLPDEAKAVIVDAVFNMGEARFEKFVHFHSAVEARNWPEAVQQIQTSAWAKENPNRVHADIVLLQSIAA
jgi:GH24 family phage-related lysozyme (muramidase)